MEAQQTSVASNSALELMHAAHSKAWQQAGLGTHPPKSPAPQGPLVPVFVHADSSKEIREHFLWRPAAGIDSGRAAAKFCSEMQVPVGLEDFVKEQINAASKKYTKWKDLGGEKLVELQLNVRHGDHVLRDSVCWDVNDPAASPECYAAQLCEDLGLDAGWAAAVAAQLQQQIEHARQAIEAGASHVEVLPPPSQLVRDVPKSAPRVMPHNPEDPTPVGQQQRAQRLAAAQPGAGPGSQAGAVQQRQGGQTGLMASQQASLGRQGSLASSQVLSAGASPADAAALLAALGRT